MLHMLRALCAKEKVVLDDVGTDVNDLLEETDVTELASNLDEKLPAYLSNDGACNAVDHAALYCLGVRRSTRAVTH